MLDFFVKYNEGMPGNNDQTCFPPDKLPLLTLFKTGFTE